VPVIIGDNTAATATSFSCGAVAARRLLSTGCSKADCDADVCQVFGDVNADCEFNAVDITEMQFTEVNFAAQAANVAGMTSWQKRALAPLQDWQNDPTFSSGLGSVGAKSIQFSQRATVGLTRFVDHYWWSTSGSADANQALTLSANFSSATNLNVIFEVSFSSLVQLNCCDSFISTQVDTERKRWLPLCRGILMPSY
jgi:hypothetical protein